MASAMNLAGMWRGQGTQCRLVRSAAKTAKFADEAPARLECAVDAGDHEFRPAHPVQRCLGEDRVELTFERQRVTVDPLHLESLGGSRSQKLPAQIGAKDVGARSRKQFG